MTAQPKSHGPRWDGRFAGHFDDVAQVIAGGKSAVTALKGSTEEAQFKMETVEVPSGTAEPPMTRAASC